METYNHFQSGMCLGSPGGGERAGKEMLIDDAVCKEAHIGWEWYLLIASYNFCCLASLAAVQMSVVRGMGGLSGGL